MALHISITEAVDIKKQDPLAKLNASIRIQIEGTEEVAQTRTINNTLGPRWYDVVKLRTTDPTDKQLTIQLLDDDEVFAQCEITLTAEVLGSLLPNMYQMTVVNEENPCQPRIRLSFKYDDFLEEEEESKENAVQEDDLVDPEENQDDEEGLPGNQDEDSRKQAPKEVEQHHEEEKRGGNEIKVENKRVQEKHEKSKQKVEDEDFNQGNSEVHLDSDDFQEEHNSFESTSRNSSIQHKTLLEKSQERLRKMGDFHKTKEDAESFDYETFDNEAAELAAQRRELLLNSIKKGFWETYDRDQQELQESINTLTSEISELKRSQQSVDLSQTTSPVSK